MGVGKVNQTQIQQIEQLCNDMQRLTTLVLELKKNISENSCEVWEIADVAKYLKLSYTHTFNFIIADPTFPSPAYMPTSTGANKKSTRRWIAGDVVKWVSNRRIQNNRRY